MPAFHIWHSLSPIMSFSCDFCMVFGPMLCFLQSYLTLIHVASQLDSPGAGLLLAVLGSVDGACCWLLALLAAIRCCACTRAALGPWLVLPEGTAGPCSSLTDTSAYLWELLQSFALSIKVYACSWEMLLQAEAWRLCRGIIRSSCCCLIIPWLQSRTQKISSKPILSRVFNHQSSKDTCKVWV